MRKGVQKIYTEVADTYQLANHILTFGFDVLWRRAAVRQAAELGGHYILDVCSGTGELAQYLSERTKTDPVVFAADFSLPMLLKGRQRKRMAPVLFTLAEAHRLPFPNDTFDQVLISFATRNLNTRKEILLTHLEEFHRVLKPGGAFINLETSQPKLALWRTLFHFYVRVFVRPVGSLVSGSKAGYRYLAYTIPRFYGADEFSSLLHSVGA